MTATLPSAVASALGLNVVGAEAYLEVVSIAADGSVVVSSEMEAPEAAMPAVPPVPEALAGMLGQ